MNGETMLIVAMLLSIIGAGAIAQHNKTQIELAKIQAGCKP